VLIKSEHFISKPKRLNEALESLEKLLILGKTYLSKRKLSLRLAPRMSFESKEVSELREESHGSKVKEG
jgi:hypothetical protein